MQHNIGQPPDKIVKNLCTFLCQDVEQTPTFAYSRTIYKGILTLQTWSKIAPGKAGKETQEKGEPAKSEDEAAKTRLSRRGAGLAFDRLSAKFGSRLLDAIPKMWHSMAGGLLSACSVGKAKPSFVVTSIPITMLWVDSPREADTAMEKQYGQDVIDSLSVLEAVSPALDPALWPRLTELFPAVAIALRSKFAIIRQTAARCFATICVVMTTEAMRFVIEQLLPLIGDAVVLSNRQGAAEAIYRSFPIPLLSSAART